MNTSRRNFLKKTSVLLAASTGWNSSIFAAPKAKTLTGVQLYSVRDDMSKDPAGSLRKLAAMGYQHVEHANYVNHRFYGYSAKEFKKVLEDNGLKMPSGHTVLAPNHWDAAADDFTDSWKKTVEDAATVGQQFVISPSLDGSLRKTQDDLKRYMDIFNRCGELCKKSGMKFGYHNHDFEFSEKLDGTSVYDIILQNTDPDLVIQQIDIGNLYNGGVKALDIMKQYPGRFVSMHVKDEIKSGNPKEPYESTLLGRGIVPVKQVIDLGKKSGGTLHFIIEQESYQNKLPMDCMKENLTTMKKWGY